MSRDAEVQKYLGDILQFQNFRGDPVLIAIKKCLTDEERYIYFAHYLDCRTQGDIGREYGVSASSISQKIAGMNRRISREVRRK